ncbi:MAG: serine/threonine-protein phosphatase [Mycobacterium sp.]|nr:serine/threonine-protein phosphatase [Mycobacterium sp.]
MPTETLLAPESVLAELNRRFRMEDHNGHYLTIFYGVYRRSTRALSYAGAGHPPALVLSGGQPQWLTSQSPPVGMFGDTEFTSQTHVLQAGARLLVYSDGAFEFERADGGQFSVAQFAELCHAVADEPGQPLDAIVGRLRSLSSTGDFEDDCSLVLLTTD